MFVTNILIKNLTFTSLIYTLILAALEYFNWVKYSKMFLFIQNLIPKTIIVLILIKRDHLNLMIFIFQQEFKSVNINKVRLGGEN